MYREKLELMTVNGITFTHFQKTEIMTTLQLSPIRKEILILDSLKEKYHNKIDKIIIEYNEIVQPKDGINDFDTISRMVKEDIDSTDELIKLFKPYPNNLKF